MSEGGGGGGDFPPKKEGLSDESGFSEKKPARQLDFTGGPDERSLSKPAPTLVTPSVSSPVVTSQSLILNAPT